MPRRALCAVALVVLLSGAAARARAATPSTPSEENLLVLQVQLGDHLLADDLLAYTHPGGVLLPVARLEELLELPISQAVKAGPQAGAQAGNDDLYVDARVLSSRVPVDFAVDTAALVLRLTPREKLPVQEKWEREARRHAAEAAREAAAKASSAPRFAVQPHPYGVLGWPVLDGNAGFSFQSGGEGPAASAFRHSFLAQGDFLAMTAALFLSGETGGGTNPLANARLVLERRDPEGRLFGAAGATEMRVGDVSVALDPLLSPGRPGRGFEIGRSAGALVHSGGSGSTDLRGDTLPGWEVELYRDGTLLDFRRVGGDGRYEFRDIPLHGGMNVLRLVFYGPQNQKREREEKIFTGTGLLPPGETAWRLGAEQQDMGFLRPAEPAAANPADPADTAPLRGALRGSFDFERGLSRSFSLGGGLSSLELTDGRHDYLRLGLGTSLPGGGGRLDLTRDLRGGWAGKLAFHGQLGPLSVALEHTELAGCRSEETENDGLRSRSEARLDVQLRIPGLPSAVPPLPVSLTVAREERVAGETLALQATSALTLPLGSSVFSNRWQLGFANGELAAGGSLHLNGRFRGFAVRGSLGYQLAPKPSLSDLDVTGEIELRRGLGLHLGVSQGLLRASTAVSGGLDWRLKALVLGLTAGLSSDGRMQVGGSMSFSLGREPRSDRPRLRTDSGSSQGAVSARVFLDGDGDGRFSAGDTPLAGIRFKTDGGSRLKAETGEDGVAWLPLSPYHRLDLSIDEDTLSDPAWVAERQGVGLVPRPGAAWTVDFPVIETGEIDGNVSLSQGGGKREVSNVRLQLVAPDGAVVQEAKSQFDGFYLFEKVRPGRYTLRVAAEQLERLRLTAVPAEMKVDLRSGEVRSGVNVVLAPVPEASGAS